MPQGKEEQARSFYLEVLGMDELPKPPELRERGGVWFRSSDVFVHLGVESDFRPATKAHPAFRCVDYEALLQRLRSHGVSVSPEERLISGRARCYITDTFGNRIELIEGDR